MPSKKEPQSPKRDPTKSAFDLLADLNGSLQHASNDAVIVRGNRDNTNMDGLGRLVELFNGLEAPPRVPAVPFAATPRPTAHAGPSQPPQPDRTTPQSTHSSQPDDAPGRIQEDAPVEEAPTGTPDRPIANLWASPPRPRTPVTHTRGSASTPFTPMDTDLDRLILFDNTGERPMPANRSNTSRETGIPDPFHPAATGEPPKASRRISADNRFRASLFKSDHPRPEAPHGPFSFRRGLDLGRRTTEEPSRPVANRPGSVPLTKSSDPANKERNPETGINKKTLNVPAVGSGARPDANCPAPPRKSSNVSDHLLKDMMKAPVPKVAVPKNPVPKGPAPKGPAPKGPAPKGPVPKDPVPKVSAPKDTPPKPPPSVRGFSPAISPPESNFELPDAMKATRNLPTPKRVKSKADPKNLQCQNMEDSAHSTRKQHSLEESLAGSDNRAKVVRSAEGYPRQMYRLPSGMGQSTIEEDSRPTKHVQAQPEGLPIGDSKPTGEGSSLETLGPQVWDSGYQRREDGSKETQEEDKELQRAIEISRWPPPNLRTTGDNVLAAAAAIDSFVNGSFPSVIRGFATVAAYEGEARALSTTFDTEIFSILGVETGPAVDALEQIVGRQQRDDVWGLTQRFVTGTQGDVGLSESTEDYIEGDQNSIIDHLAALMGLDERNTAEFGVNAGVDVAGCERSSADSFRAYARLRRQVSCKQCPASIQARGARRIRYPAEAPTTFHQRREFRDGSALEDFSHLRSVAAQIRLNSVIGRVVRMYNVRLVSVQEDYDPKDDGSIAEFIARFSGPAIQSCG
ncbi:hypothetical protein HDK90DRAFT_528203 [Phyllosticta capitalensis]|uniref:Uncharacterized protein n=1 Tax=Phyllosticta capitalensis TaxID=121624 RepID=A0ABR1YC57_9PEZI